MAKNDTIWVDLLGVEYTQKFYDVDGVRTRTIEAGEGFPFILLHGGGGHAETWVRNLGPLAPLRKVYALDMVGHGFTDAPDDLVYNTDTAIEHVVKFMDTLGIEKADISGESFGGRVASWIAIRHPERINKLVLNTSGGLPATDDKHQDDIEDLLTRTKASLENTSDDAVRSRIGWLFANPELVPEEFVKIRQAIYRRPGIHNSLSKLFGHVFNPESTKPYWLTPEVLATIQAKTLVIWSDKNPIHSYEDALAGFSHIPDVRFHLIHDAAHWPQYEQPEEYNKIQNDFLQED